MMHFFYIFIFFFTSYAHGFFSYDQAAALIEQGKYDQAKTILQQLLVDKHDWPEVLYDMGIVLYKLKEYAQAQAYFKRVTEMAQTTIDLKEKAYFNAGNCAAAHKDYKKAIEEYQGVLAINKSNEMARHNLEQVKKMMQEQEQQKQNKENQENKDNKQNKDQQEKNESQEKQQDNANNNGSNKEEQKRDEMNQDSDDQQKQRQSEQDKKDSSSNDQNRDKKESQERNEKNRQEQEQKGHTQSTEKNNAKQQKQNSDATEKDQADQGQEESLQQTDGNPEKEKLDPHLARILEMQEKKDAQTNKRMINAIVGEAMGGAQSENCW